MVAAVSQTQTQTPGAMQVSPPRVRRQQDFPIIELDITVNNVEFDAVARRCRRKRVAKPPQGPRPVPRPNATLGPHGGPDNRPADVVQSTTPVQADGKRMDRLVRPSAAALAPPFGARAAEVAGTWRRRLGSASFRCAAPATWLGRRGVALSRSLSGASRAFPGADCAGRPTRWPG